MLEPRVLISRSHAKPRPRVPPLRRWRWPRAARAAGPSSTRSIPGGFEAMHQQETWPALPLAEWQDTYMTLHMYSQVVGKVRLESSPMTNQWWQVPLYLTARGLTTSPIAHGDRNFQLDFDFFDHELVALTSEGASRRIPLGSAVKDFYARVMDTLEALSVPVEIWPVPVEVADP